jgi:ABC-type Mn2+/Zn2+ transport system ATPase subunit
MSPGKKGTVLLLLFLELSSSENPILIDQPEDNLDNRTIYDLLCKMIRRKKRDRQIIIVTHNANLVVNTDAENVIVANQEGQDSSTVNDICRTKFEYANGPIELSFTSVRFGKLLSKMGIKQHICDILEGGKEAFKLRELKYQGD